MTVWYHGTSPEAAAEILKNGFVVDQGKRDVGDLGLGVYFTRILARAKSYGSVVVQAELTGNLASLPNPYLLDGVEEVEPTTPEEALFEILAFDEQRIMLTVKGSQEERLEVSTAIRTVFLHLGYDGIVSDNPDEAVVFNEDIIQLLEEK